MSWLGALSKDSSGEKPTVLLVEDEEELQLLGKSLLGTLPINLLMAASGTQALSLAREHRPDLILLDIVMPVMDGLQALQLLKEDRQTKDIPVLMLSSREKDYDRARKLGAHGCLPKPYDNDVFVARISRALGLSEPAA